jgi:HK97 family phage major capsid protein
MPSLAEVRENLYAKRAEMFKIREEAGPDLDMNAVTLIDGDSTAKVAEIRRRESEINELGAEFERLDNARLMMEANDREYKRMIEPANPMIHASANGSGHGSGHGAAGGSGREPSLRNAIMQSKSYQAFRAGTNDSFQIELPYTDVKALITLTTITPQNIRRPDMVELALEERTVSDLMLQGGVDRSVVEYYEETAFTNNATMTAEGVAKTESDFTTALRSDTVRKVAHWLQATTEALADIPFLETQMRGRLAFGVRRKEEQQILSGDGTGQNILGVLNRSGIQTQAVGGAVTAMDAVYIAMQKIRGSAGLGFAEPTGIVMHPSNWTNIKLTKTADGIYLYGAPADEGVDRLWGLTIRQTTGITAGTALVGAFRPHSEILRREGITIRMSEEHASFAIENKVLLVAESRLGLAVYRPSAFCTVTALP